MSDVLTHHTLFKPAHTNRTKGDITSRAAQAIVGEEAARREAKTARLRQARLLAEAILAAAPAPAKSRASKPKPSRRSPRST